MTKRKGMDSSPKKITQAQTMAFAELSGDYNPVHSQPNYARRSMFGDSVVHGVHLLFASLEEFIYRFNKNNISIESLNVNFHNPVFHHASLNYHYANNSPNDLHVTIRDGVNQLIAEYKMRYTSIAGSQYKVNDKSFSPAKVNIIEAIDKIKLDDGFTLLPHYDFDALNKLFPHLHKNFNRIQLAELLAYTRFIGMHCPGLHSLFSGISIKTKTNASDHVLFAIKDVVPRFSMVNFSLQGPTLAGTLKSFFRPSVQKQNTLAQISEQVLSNEFIHQKALIIGGSRGIGEAVAKIFAAGKGIATITYNAGEAEADHVIQDIVNSGGTANKVHYNATAPQFEALLKQGPFTHIFYFASPAIFVKSGGEFSPELMQKFVNFYVIGFENLIDGLLASEQNALNNSQIFYPSSVAVEEKTSTLDEYWQAKVQGEKLCAELREKSHLNIHVERLPRIATDQTLTLTNYPAANAVNIMLPIIRKISHYDI